MRTKLITAALFVACVLLLALFVQKRDLRTEVVELRAQRDWPHPGLVLPTFRAATVAGDSITIGRSEGNQLLLIFDVGCGNCLVSLPEWARVYEALKDDLAVEVYGVSLNSLPETLDYIQTHELPYPVVRLPEEKLISLLHVSGYPLSIVIDSNGVTDFVIRGSMPPDVPELGDSLITAALGSGM